MFIHWESAVMICHVSSWLYQSGFSVYCSVNQSSGNSVHSLGTLPRLLESRVARLYLDSCSCSPAFDFPVLTCLAFDSCLCLLPAQFDLPLFWISLLLLSSVFFASNVTCSLALTTRDLLSSQTELPSIPSFVVPLPWLSNCISVFDQSPSLSVFVIYSLPLCD